MIKHIMGMRKEKIVIGPRAQKILVLLQAGVTLSLTTRPDVFFKVIRDTSKELKRINQRTLQRAVSALYRSNLISYKENSDGTTTLVLNEHGKKKALRYNLAAMAIEKPKKWDGLWRIVLFDIPEKNREGRVALMQKLKQLGFYPIQKSVFIFPYECKNEIDFVTEIFELRPYVRFFLVKEADVDLALRRTFNLHR